MTQVGVGRENCAQYQKIHSILSKKYSAELKNNELLERNHIHLNKTCSVRFVKLYIDNEIKSEIEKKGFTVYSVSTREKSYVGGFFGASLMITSPLD